MGSGCVKQGGWEQGQEKGDKEWEGKGKEDRSGGRRETGKLAPAFSFILPHHTLTVQGPHLRGCGLPGSRGLLPSPLEVGAVPWALGLRPGTVSGALAGLGLAIPTFCGGLLGWPGVERPGERSRDPEGTGAQCGPRPSLPGPPSRGGPACLSIPTPPQQCLLTPGHLSSNRAATQLS